MADVAQTLALVVLAQNYKGDVVRQINRQSVALKVLPFVKGEGKNCAWVPESSGIIAENFSDGADAANFGSDAQASALLNWGLYRSNFHVTGLAMATAATSRTPMGNIALWGRNYVNAGSALANLINAELFTGAGTGTLIAGFDQAIGSVSNTYAGIDRSQVANAYFRPYVVNPGAPTALTEDQIRLDLAAIYTQCGMRPDVAFVNPAVLRKIGGLFDGAKRYEMRTDVVPTRGQRADVKFEGGVGAIYFDGCWFCEDKDATTGAIYYVNTQHVRLEYLPMDLYEIPGMDDEIVMGMADDGFGMTPLGTRLEMLGKLGDSDRAQMKTYVQLVCDRPNACGKRLNVAVS